MEKKNHLKSQERASSEGERRKILKVDLHKLGMSKEDFINILPKGLRLVKTDPPSEESIKNAEILEYPPQREKKTPIMVDGRKLGISLEDFLKSLPKGSKIVDVRLAPPLPKDWKPD